MRDLFVALVSWPLFLAAAPAYADVKEARPVKVALYVSEPFVIDSGSGEYSGLAVDLWEMVSDRLGMRNEYILYDSIKEVVDAAQNGTVDFVAFNFAVTHERAELLKFSFPWYDEGARIMVKKNKRPPSVWAILRQRGHIGVYMGVVLFIAGLTIAYRVFMRRKDSDFPGGWLEGLSLSLYKVVCMAKLGGEIVEKNFFGWLGHILLALWMLTEFSLLAYVTSTLSSAMTTADMQYDGGINSLNYLPGKRVGALAYSVDERRLLKIGAKILPFETLDEGVDALVKDETDALVMDAAVLEHWVYNHPSMNVEIVGNLLNAYKYAFAAGKKHSVLMDSVSEEIIRLLDDGTVENLKNQYFGSARF